MKSLNFTNNEYADFLSEFNISDSVIDPEMASSLLKEELGIDVEIEIVPSLSLGWGVEVKFINECEYSMFLLKYHE